MTDEAGDCLCLPESRCVDLEVANVKITAYKKGFKCEYVYGQAHDTQPQSCLNNSNSVNL